MLRQLDDLVGKQALFAGGKSGKGPAGKQALFLLYLDAISVVNQQAAGRQAASVEQHEQPNDHLPATQATAFTLRDLQFVVKFAQVYLTSQVSAHCSLTLLKGLCRAHPAGLTVLY